MSDRSASVPPVVAAYFGPEIHPFVSQTFTPGAGWRSWPRYRKRISGAWTRKLRREGVTVVALSGNGRLADFTIAELLRSLPSTRIAA